MSNLDLSNNEIKRLFADFVNEQKRAHGWTNEVLADKVGWDCKTIDRYLKPQLGSNKMPETLHEKKYLDLLAAIKSSDASFQEFVQQQAQTNTTSQNTGQGATQIGALNIHAGATLNQSPIGVSVVNFGPITNNGLKQ